MACFSLFCFVSVQHMLCTQRSAMLSFCPFPCQTYPTSKPDRCPARKQRCLSSAWSSSLTAERALCHRLPLTLVPGPRLFPQTHTLPSPGSDRRLLAAEGRGWGGERGKNEEKGNGGALCFQRDDVFLARSSPRLRGGSRRAPRESGNAGPGLAAAARCPQLGCRGR